MSGTETGQANVNDDHLREFVEAIKLIEPYCVVGAIPGRFSYETTMDVRQDETIPSDTIDAEVIIDKSSAEPELAVEGIPPWTDYGLSMREESINVEGRLVAIKRSFNVFASVAEDDTDEERLEPFQDETTYVEDTTGRLQRQWPPVVEKMAEADKARKAGNLEEYERLKAEAGEIHRRDINMEQANGTQKYRLHQHLAAMAIIHKIHEELGIKAD